jgi:hypothetical protein
MDDSQINRAADRGRLIMRRIVHSEGVPEQRKEFLAASVMLEICGEADKGEGGALAVKSLIKIWQDLKLGDVSGETISQLSRIVDQIYEKEKAGLVG